MRLPPRERFTLWRNRFVYATNQTWPALYAAIAVVAVWVVWNTFLPPHSQFDPFPYVGLGVFITVITWWQNYIILIVSEELKTAATKQEAAEIKRQERMLHLVEAVYAIATLHLHRRNGDVASVETENLDPSGVDLEAPHPFEPPT